MSPLLFFVRLFKAFFFGYNKKAEGAALKVKTLNDSHGFVGLMELMIIIGIIGILTVMSTPTFRSLRQRAKEAVAIQDMGNNIRPAIESFRVDVGEFPANGYGLLSNPYSAGTSKNSRWLSGGPYMKAERVAPPNPDTDDWMEDPWGKPYVIFSVGFTGCVIVSSGKDGALQTTTPTLSATEPNRSTGRFSLPSSGTDDLGVVINW